MKNWRHLKYINPISLVAMLCFVLANTFCVFTLRRAVTEDLKHAVAVKEEASGEIVDYTDEDGIAYDNVSLKAEEVSIELAHADFNGSIKGAIQKESLVPFIKIIDEYYYQGTEKQLKDLYLIILTIVVFNFVCVYTILRGHKIELVS